jgi:hypothetical protein
MIFGLLPQLRHFLLGLQKYDLLINLLAEESTTLNMTSIGPGEANCILS